MGKPPLKVRALHLAAEIFVWTLLSAFVEVAVTATVERISLGDRYVLAGVPFASLQGHTTLWVVIVAVGLTLSLRWIVGAFEHAQRARTFLRHRLVQCTVVMLLIYALELAGGELFNRHLGWHLWDYSQYVWHGIPLHLDGQITLVYAPFWFAAGFFVRPIYKAVHSIVPDVGDSFRTFFDAVDD